MAKENLSDMTEKEFMKSWTQAAKDLEEARERVAGFSAEQKRRDAVKILDDMPEEQRQMLAQYVATEGVKSKEGVNGG